MPLLSSALTTVLVFLPLMLAEHVAGEYTRSISLVILITLSTSWLFALCVTPTLCYFFISDSQGDGKEKNLLLCKRSIKATKDLSSGLSDDGYCLYLPMIRQQIKVLLLLISTL